MLAALFAYRSFGNYSPGMGADQASAEGIVTVAVEDAVGLITLRSPALSRLAKEQLLAGLRQLSGDGSVRAVVLTGSGKVFCAGQDLREHAAALEADPASAFGTLAEHYNPIVVALTTMPKPVVAAINGTCAGAGISLALACDLRVCSNAAKFATAFTGIGLTFDSGLSATLTRAVGAARASELILLGEPFTAQQALDCGMVGRLADPDRVLSEALGLASRLAAGPTLAYAEAKKAIQAVALPALNDVLASEVLAQSRLGLTADHQKAVEAFVAKRRPEFHGR
jgi:2-(1,2-epoxy-1,2-dihydrophenyl)acetyl-CoA isomerase